MIKRIIIASIITATVISCKKSNGDQSKLPNESNATISKEKSPNESENQEYTYRYVAEDGTNALVTFTNTTDGNYISIRSNNRTIKVKQKEAWAKGALYEENGIEVKTAGDLLSISQDNALIELRKAKGQQ